MHWSKRSSPISEPDPQIGSKTIQLKLSRLLPASREEVFDMWLDPESMKRWMRPGDSEAIFIDLHPVVGGTFRIDTRTQDGRVVVHTGQYIEIKRPDKLVFSWNSSVLGDRSSQVTVEFHDQAGDCLMVLLHDLPPDEAIFESHRKGWTAILDLFVQHQKTNTP